MFSIFSQIDIKNETVIFISNRSNKPVAGVYNIRVEISKERRSTYRPLPSDFDFKTTVLCNPRKAYPYFDYLDTFNNYLFVTISVYFCKILINKIPSPTSHVTTLTKDVVSFKKFEEKFEY